MFIHSLVTRFLGQVFYTQSFDDRRAHQVFYGRTSSSGRIGLAVWARWVLGVWVSDGRLFGGNVSLRGLRICLALGGFLLGLFRGS